MRHASILRVLTTGLLFAGGLLYVQAQGPYRYLVQVAELNSPYQEKLVHDLLRNGYPMMAVRVDTESATIELGSASMMDRQQLTADLASYGFTLTAMYRQDRSGGFHRWLAVGTGQGIPTYQDTGDPIADQAAYEAAKEAWLQDQDQEFTQAGR